MPKPPVAPRPMLHDPSGPRVVSMRAKPSRRSAVLGVGVGAVLFTTVAQGAPNPLWPPDRSVALSELAQTQYWPSDEEYGYGYTSLSGSTENAGQWWLYSFVPERSTSAIVLRQPNLAAGLSVDAAWQRSRGTPQVVLAFLDDGLDWANPDLASSIFLNVGELKHNPPTHADGSACERLEPNVKDSPPVDCSSPPDGVLSIDDFREVLGWLDGNTGTDPNGNGILDPGDLLLLGYADQVDDDENGFVDDIAGWDFIGFDNNPFPALSTNGTESALDAIAATNNDIGRAGVCPRCRGLAVRVGHQRGASPQTLALGLLYASSLGATAALVGHLPAGRARVLDAALRTTSQRNLLTLLPRDGEQQVTPSLRFDSDATRIVGTLTQLNGSTMSTGSFISKDPCQSFEPGPILMSAAPVCSRRGPGIALGVAGLVASAARDQTPALRLSAQELAATLSHAANTVDNALSTPGTIPAVEQKNLLRLNANAAMVNLEQGLVPPDVDLERPRWYETVALSQSLPMPVIGRIAAPHSNTFDVFVELALGVPKSTGEYTIIYSRKGIPSDVRLNSGTLLTEADLRRWHASVQPQLDNPASTGGIATLRVRVVANLSATKEDASPTVESTTQRQVVIVTDRDLLNGFPYSVEATTTAPKLVDLDGDGAREIVFGTIDGRLLALSAKQGTPIDSFDNAVISRLLPSYQRLRNSSVPTSQASSFPPMLAGTPPVPLALGTEPIVDSTAAADLDDDGEPEIVFAGESGRIYVVKRNGTALKGWPRCLESPDLVDCPAVANSSPKLSTAPVLADIDGDGRLEIIVAANDGYVYAFENDGFPTQGWPVRIEMKGGQNAGTVTSSPATADMNGDQIADLVLAVGEPRAQADYDASQVFTILGAPISQIPTVAHDWPITVTSYDFDVDRQTRRSPPTAIDLAQSAPRALLYGNATRPFFVPIEPGSVSSSSRLPRHAEPDLGDNGVTGFTLLDRGMDSTLTDEPALAPLYARPTLADLDRDGQTDLVLPATTATTLDSLRNTSAPEHRSLLLFWSGKTGRMLPASPILLDDFVGAASAVVADLTNDGYPEMIIPSGSGTLVAYDACGRSPKGWPKVLGGAMSQPAAIGDLDGDGFLEVVAVTDDGRVFAWHTEAGAESYVPWGSAQHDNLNQSAHRIPVGTVPAFAVPLQLTAAGNCVARQESPPPSVPSPQLSARGGCQCDLLGGSTSNARYALGFALFAVLLGARRRFVTSAHAH